MLELTILSTPYIFYFFFYLQCCCCCFFVSFQIHRVLEVEQQQQFFSRWGIHCFIFCSFVLFFGLNTITSVKQNSFIHFACVCVYVERGKKWAWVTTNKSSAMWKAKKNTRHSDKWESGLFVCVRERTSEFNLVGVCFNLSNRKCVVHFKCMNWTVTFGLVVLSINGKMLSFFSYWPISNKQTNHTVCNSRTHTSYCHYFYARDRSDKELHTIGSTIACKIFY